MIRNVLYAALYLGGGALVHLAVAGPTFDPASVLSWACVLGWPIMVSICAIVVVLAAILLAALVCGVAWLVAVIVQAISFRIWKWRRGRQVGLRL